MIDILYLGVNMGNAGYRFFPRYKHAEEDYYMTFRWLVLLKRQYPSLNIAIKHHSGHYEPRKDTAEMDITRGIINYVDNRLDSYHYALESKICVSYCSTMILELNGQSNIGKYIYKQRHHKFVHRKPCTNPIGYFNDYSIPAYYLDPGLRNRQFCMYIDDVNIHKCGDCRGYDLEVFDKYRLSSYNHFKFRIKTVLDK